jgi:L-amino acid N-acyltransferase YncA
MGIATVRHVSETVRIDLMTADDWPRVRQIYGEGISTGDATLEREAPDWDHFDRSHRRDCRLVARARPAGPVLGWTALSAYSSRRVYAGVAWESVYVAAAAGLWTLLAGVMSDNRASLALHESVGFRQVGVQRALGQDAGGRWRDVVLLERRSLVVGAG